MSGTSLVIIALGGFAIGAVVPCFSDYMYERADLARSQRELAKEQLKQLRLAGRIKPSQTPPTESPPLSPTGSRRPG